MKGLEWTEEAEDAIRQLLQEASIEDREGAEKSTREQTEALVKSDGREAVMATDVVAGYIVQTPQHLRDGLRNVLTNIGYDPDDFRKYFDMHQGREGFRSESGESGAHGLARFTQKDWTPHQGPGDKK